MDFTNELFLPAVAGIRIDVLSACHHGAPWPTLGGLNK